MKKQQKKLTLNKETLRDLMAHNAGDVKGGAKSKNCYTIGRRLTACGPTCPQTQTCAYSCYCTPGLACY